MPKIYAHAIADNNSDSLTAFLILEYIEDERLSFAHLKASPKTSN